MGTADRTVRALSKPFSAPVHSCHLETKDFVLVFIRTSLSLGFLW